LRQLEFSFYFNVIAAISRIHLSQLLQMRFGWSYGTDYIALGIFARNSYKIRFTIHQMCSELPTGPGYGHCGLVNGYCLSQAVAKDAALRWQTRLDEASGQARVWLVSVKNISDLGLAHAPRPLVDAFIIPHNHPFTEYKTAETRGGIGGN